MSKYEIHFYFSFADEIEANTEEEAILEAEKRATDCLTSDLWGYFDDREVYKHD